MKKLLILTSDYPYVTGDGSFLINEIDDLSNSFDKIYIARKKKLIGVKEYDLPPNVELIFSGFKDRKSFILKGVFNFSKLPLSLFFQDIKEITSLTFLFRFFLSFLFGRAVSSDSKIKKIINENKNDLAVYSFWGTGMGYMIPWLQKEVKIFVKLHGGDLYDYRSGYIPFRKYNYKRAHKILVISQDGKEYVSRFLDKNKISSKKVELVRLGTKSHYSNKVLHLFDEMVVVSCSYILPVKRVNLIYKVLEETSKNIKIRWVHFGGGALEEELKEQVKQTNNLVVNFKGSVTNKEIIDFYKSTKVDMFVNLSSSEGIPVSIMEAISFNIPVLATNAGGTSEIVGEDLKTGVLIPIDFDIKKAIDSVKKILNMHNEFYPSKHWEENFSCEKNNKKLIEILKNG